MDKKIALVTGASRGIGYAIARKLAADGMYVIGTATSEQSLLTIDALLGDNGESYKIDISSNLEIEKLLNYLSDDAKSPDVLINNAGITVDNLLLRMEEEEWHKVLSTNLTSVFRLSKGCLRAMFKKRWGRIISIGSVVGAQVVTQGK